MYTHTAANVLETYTNSVDSECSGRRQRQRRRRKRLQIIKLTYRKTTVIGNPDKTRLYLKKEDRRYIRTRPLHKKWINVLCQHLLVIPHYVGMGVGSLATQRQTVCVQNAIETMRRGKLNNRRRPRPVVQLAHSVRLLATL